MAAEESFLYEFKEFNISGLTTNVKWCIIVMSTNVENVIWEEVNKKIYKDGIL